MALRKVAEGQPQLSNKSQGSRLPQLHWGLAVRYGGPPDSWWGIRRGSWDHEKVAIECLEERPKVQKGVGGHQSGSGRSKREKRERGIKGGWSCVQAASQCACLTELLLDHCSLSYLHIQSFT